MSILLDTNIIIPLEDTSRILDSSFAELRKLSAEQQHCLYIHPIQFEDIKRDKNLERQKIVLSRLKQYSQIDNPPILTEKDCLKLGLSQSNDNDRVDNNVLFALYRGAVHLLVTNDQTKECMRLLFDLLVELGAEEDMPKSLQKAVAPKIPQDQFGIQSHKYGFCQLHKMLTNKRIRSMMLKQLGGFFGWNK